jgi:transcriptional regulator with XRE-family HTH domain
VLANLKTAIAARRTTQVDLALDLKIAPTVLSEIIHGRRQADPSLRARIAEALEADESWLFSTVTRIPRPAEASPVGHP